MNTPVSDTPSEQVPSTEAASPPSVFGGLARTDEPIGEKLRTLARLGGWPVMFAVGNWLSDVPVRTGSYNALLALSFVFVVLTQLVYTVRLEYWGIDLFPSLSDAVVLFGLSYLSGGVASPLRDTYFLFMIVHAIGLRIRRAVLIATLYSLSYALIEVLGPTDPFLTRPETLIVARQVLYLFWTAITAGLLAGILRSATERASSAAVENAILFERAERSTSDLRSVLNSTENGIAMVDTDLRVRFINRRMGEFLGADLSDTVGKYKPNVVRQRLKRNMKDPDGFEARLLELYHDMEREAIDEVEVARPTPRLLSRYSGPVRDDAGKLLGRIEVYSDVTEERTADLLKDEFLSLAAHELKTPITSLKAYAQLLRRRPLQELTPKLIENALTTIDRQASQLTVLVNDLLDVSRAETGHLELHLEDIDVTDTVRRATEQIADTNTDHRVEMPAAEAIAVRADPLRIEQVAVNLLTNAVKYSPDGGCVTVTVRRDGSEAVTRVSDEGIGIPQEKLAHIFDRFYQAHATSRYSYGGMGIGLYICKQIINRHHGRMWVESEEGKGSAFYFSLPVKAGVDE